MTIGERLYELRKEKGLSQESAANILGVTRQTVSKWETDQSTPDFDKIIPICDLYGISSEELLRNDFHSDKKEETVVESVNEPFERYEFDQTDTTEYEDNKYNAQRKKSAVFMSSAIALYILSVTPFLIIKGKAAVVVFFIIIAVATMLVVYSALSRPKNRRDDMDKNKPIMKRIESILSGIVLVIYLLLSFLTHGWAYTWIIWVIYGVIMEIVKLVFVLKEDKNEK